MAVLDLVMLLILGGTAMFGFSRGFVQEVLSLVAWGLAIVAERLFFAPLSDLFSLWMGRGGGAAILAFALLFGVSLLAGRLFAQRIGRSSRSSILGPMDRVLGAGFGALKGLIGASLLFLAFNLVYNMLYGIETDRPMWMTSARSYPLLDASAKALTQFAHDSKTAYAAMEGLKTDNAADAANALQSTAPDKDEGR